MIEPVKKAAQKVGSPAQLARELGVPRPNLYNWRRVPAHHVFMMAVLSGMQPHELRPDIWPDPEEEETK